MNDMTIHHTRTFTHRDGASYSILLQAETDTGRDWVVETFGALADPIIDRAGLDIALQSFRRNGIKHAWTVGDDLEKAIDESWGPGVDYADPIRVVECNDRLRITWDNGELHGRSETWMLHGSHQVDTTGATSTQAARWHAAKGQWKRCHYSVSHWGSHPDAGNDDCYTGEDYVELYEAINAVTELPTDPSVAFIELVGSKPEQQLRCVIPNPGFDLGSRNENDDWTREMAQHAGMAHGIEAYNDAMGNTVDDPDYEDHLVQQELENDWGTSQERRDDKEDGREDDSE